MPNIATLEGRVDRKRLISGYFRKVLQQYETQAFAGPPENIRDHILAAAKALQAGDWRQCRDLVSESVRFLMGGCGFVWVLCAQGGRSSRRPTGEKCVSGMAGGVRTRHERA